jgi:hypothetical protein
MATRSGRSGSITVNSVNIPITKWTAKLSKELADSTDSSNYDVASGQTYKAQVPGVISIEATVEGNFDSAASTGVINKLKSDPMLPVVLKLDATTTFCSGSFDLSDAEVSVEVPGATMVSFTATVKSNGVFILN